MPHTCILFAAKTLVQVSLVIAGYAAIGGCMSGDQRARATTPSAQVAMTPAGDLQSSPRVTAPMFQMLLGETWTGNLTYRDYTTNTSVVIPCTLQLEKEQPSGPPTTLATYKWMTGYNDEPHANSATRFALLHGGRTLENGDNIERVVAVASTPSGSETEFGSSTIVVITEHESTDDNRTATVRKVYVISSHAFSVQKLVRVAGEPTSFERHIYRWTREKQ